MEKTKKIKSPIKLVVSFADRESTKDMEEYLNNHHLSGGVVFMGKGTAESEIADIFGFGMAERDVLACLIPTQKVDKVVRDLNDISRIELDNYGLLFVMDLQSAGSNLLEFLKVNVEE